MGMGLVLVGCGAMGSALLKGWLTQTNSNNSFNTFWVITPHKASVTPFLEDKRVKWFSSPKFIPSSPDVILFALKPNLLDKVLPLYSAFQSIIISVASGKPISFYEKHFPPNHSIVRAMPNTPVNIHQGVIGLRPNKHVTANQKSIVETCFKGLGFCQWVNTDEEIDKLTAITGSGPAYVFLMIESLTKAAESLGFDKKTSHNLALHTFLGASEYVLQSHETPEILRNRVTSPSGTTAAALNIFEKGQLTKLIENAVKAAFTRAKELAK